MATQTTYMVSPIIDSIKEKKLHHIPLQIKVPGSKSITNRVLLISALAEGSSIIYGCLFSDDSRHFLDCLKNLGFDVMIDEKKNIVRVTGNGGKIPRKEASIYVGSAGTAARFLTAMLGLSDGIYHLDASEQMKKRPMAPLLHSLSSLGVQITYQEKEGYFPFTLTSDPANYLYSHEITVNIDHSSQFLSALMMTGCLKKDGLQINIEGTHGFSYIQMTSTIMKQFGCQIYATSPQIYDIPPNQIYQAKQYQVEPDVSGACYFYAMSPLLHIPVLVSNIHLDSMQGDIRFLSILEQMGCKLYDTKEGILISPPPTLEYSGIEVDLSDCSDQTMTLAILSIFAKTPTTIKNIGHIRYQECNRLDAIYTELKRMQIDCTKTDTSITIYPGCPQPTCIHTYDDHRMAMAFSLVGLRVPGITIQNPDCCRKTFENFFELLDDITQIYQLESKILSNSHVSFADEMLLVYNE